MNHGNNFIKTVTYPPRVIIYHHRHAHAPQNARDFRNDFDVDNPSKMSLFSVFFHSVLCCSGMSDHLLFKRMFFGRSAGRRRQYIGLQGDYWKGICAAFTNFANFSSDRLCGKISISFPNLQVCASISRSIKLY